MTDCEIDEKSHTSQYKMGVKEISNELMDSKTLLAIISHKA